MFYSGHVLNLSEKGMFISTRRFYPVNSILNIHIENERANIFTGVRWCNVKSAYLNGIGVEILNPQEEYLEFIESLCSNLQILVLRHRNKLT